MDILVIGNGFDLEHGLPTQYKDFLDFMSIFKILLTSKQDYVLDGIFSRKKIETQLGHEVNKKVVGFLEEYFIADSDKFNSWREDDNTNILVKCISSENNKENFWLKYFTNDTNYVDKLWVDFENEISKVIQAIEYSRRGYRFYQRESRKRGPISAMSYFEEMDERKNELIKKIIKYLGYNSTSWMLENELIEKIIDILKNDLNEITQCLEIYLCEYVEKIEINKKSKYIRDGYYDYVLSFNYTNTFEKLYNLKNYVDVKQYCYVHGKADIEKHKTSNYNKIVLGIDEYLDDNEKNENLDFIYFKKFYQRIYNTTDINYRKWINRMNMTSREMRNISVKENKIYIFGHSLDVSDRQILRQLILESGKKKDDGTYENNTRIIIYYKGKETKSSQIKNLVKIIGEDELTERYTNGNIVFVEQD